MKFQSLTNVKPTKDLGTQLVAAPTPGQFKLTPDGATLMGVAVGDYLQILRSGEDFYASKGEKGVGSKLSSPNAAGGGIFTFSSANAWQEIEGSSEHNTHFDIDADEPYTDEETGRVYFKLSLAERVEKQKKGKKSTEDAPVAEGNAVDTPVDEGMQSFDDM